MAGSATVAVQATEERYRALSHYPSGIGFETDGTARWPADQFTFRLRDEGAIQLLEDLHDTGAPVADEASSSVPDPSDILELTASAAAHAAATE